MATIGISEMLCEVIRSESEYKQLYNTLYKFISGGSRFSQGPSLITGLSDGARNVLCASLAAESAFLTGEDGKKTPLILVPDEKTAYSMRSKLSAFLGNVYVFPARDFNFYNVGALSKEWEYERLKVLRALVSGECDAVLAVPEAALALLPPAEYLRKGKALKIGDTVPVAALVKTLDEYGYVRVDTVEGAGQYSLRGDILDIFVPDNDYPLRLEFFGDEIDAAGFFDTMTQRRTENVTEFAVTPVRETVIPPEKYALIEEKIDALITSALRKKNQTLAEKLSAERIAYKNADFAAADKYLPYLYDDFTTLFDYARGLCVVCDYPRVKERLNAFLYQLHETLTDLASAGEMSLADGVWCKTYEDLKYLLTKRPSA